MDVTKHVRMHRGSCYLEESRVRSAVLCALLAVLCLFSVYTLTFWCVLTGDLVDTRDRFNADTIILPAEVRGINRGDTGPLHTEKLSF